jgi:hypothetical protein
MKWAGHVASTGERKGVYRVVVRKNEGNRPLGRSRRRWKDSIKMDCQEVGWGSMDWIYLAQNKSNCECGNETLGSIKCGEFFCYL